MKRGIGIGFLLSLLFCIGIARGEVRDDAGFFSSDAIKRANDATQQMRRDLGKEMLIETFAQIPADRASGYSAQNKDQFFEKWGNQRAEQEHVDGVYILIDKNPAYLFVTAGNKTQQRDFTQSDERELRDAMLALLKQKDNDGALNKAIEFVPARVRENQQRTGGAGASGTKYQPPPLPEGQTAPQSQTQGQTAPRTQTPGPTAPFPSGPSFHISGLVCFGLFLLVGFIILRAIFGRRNSAAGGYGGRPGYGGYGGYPPGSGGGGFGRGMLGGLFGGLASGWLTNRLNRPSNPGYGAPPVPPDASNTGLGGGFNDSGGDTSFSGGAGGGFDNSGGGGGGGGGGGSDSGGSSDSGSGGSF